MKRGTLELKPWQLGLLKRVSQTMQWMDFSATQNELPTHELDVCERFTNLAISERRKFAHSNPLCWGYLKWGHVSKECRGHATADTQLHYMMMPWHTRIERQIQKVVKQRRETRYPIALKYVPETPASIQCGIPLLRQYRLTTRLMKTTSSQVHDLRFTWWSIWHLLHRANRCG